MSALTAGVLVDAAALSLAHEAVPPEQVVAGAPTTGYATIDESDASEIGVWEMSVGAMSDVEVDETFVVIAGAATVEFVDPPLPTIALAPGSVVKLVAGMKTVWTVREPLRKIYFAT
ncbi:cupin domain-containing protein [Microbacterium sp. NPDC076911]|uniref:cupin domain-containing protein n=1 Tax=Microbacterium sp. NPDC076911 TaxID=3154958 RepID=UPI0034221CBB